MRTSPTRRPANSLATAVSVLAAIAIGLVVLDAIVDHRPAQGGGRRPGAVQLAPKPADMTDRGAPGRAQHPEMRATGSSR
jgi:hypothetical protein